MLINRNGILQEVKIIKEYKTFILVEHKEGYRECINKLDFKIEENINE